MRRFMFCVARQILFRIKSRRMRWAGHVALMKKRRVSYRVLVGKPDRRGSWQAVVNAVMNLSVL
jgi:hypothetical protein